jgi:hypothetical protein
MLLPLILYGVLLSLTFFAPLRLAMVAYLLLSVVDFNTANAGIGVLNATRGLVCPVILMWRLREFAGHGRITLAPIAWLLLIFYAAIASIWSLFTLSAIKLVAEMAGSFLIAMVFLRASKGRYLTPEIALPAGVGVILIAAVRMTYIQLYGDVFSSASGGMSGDTPDRFTAFTTAQAFAALLTALYAIAVTSRTISIYIRAPLCLGIIIALLFNGSRLWLIALIVATVLGLLVSEAPTWFKIVGLGAIMLAMIGVVAASELIIDALQGAHQYRIAAAIVAAYEGNEKDTGLGTVVLRRHLDTRALELIERGNVLQLCFGHGTSNGRMIVGDINRGIGDPNRSVHNEWLRILYEWGFVGIILWLLFIGSLLTYAANGLKRDSLGFAKPLFIYVPAFCIGVSGENIIAGAGHAENIGLLLVIGIAAIAHRSKAVNPKPVSGVNPSRNLRTTQPMHHSAGALQAE